MAEGFGLFRVPFLFQNIQPSSGAALNEAAMRQLDPVIAECAAKHVVRLLDMHNYGSYYRDDTVTAQGLPGAINVSNTRLAALDWVKTANAIAAAIRATGATNKIVFQGRGTAPGAGRRAETPFRFSRPMTRQQFCVRGPSISRRRRVGHLAKLRRRRRRTAAVSRRGGAGAAEDVDELSAPLKPLRLAEHPALKLVRASLSLPWF
jgi:hypothetical protein